MTVRAKVIGQFEIVGVDGKSVAAPGVVELDETVTNVPALVQAGHIEPPVAAKPAAKQG